MKIKFPTGTTEENNRLTLPEGMLSVDVEKKAIRLHDGTTQGGFEIIGRIYIPLTPPTNLWYTTDYLNANRILDWAYTD